MMLAFALAQTTAMKYFLSIFAIMGFTTLMWAQSPLNEEMLQARMHYMNQAKVSYLASVIQPSNPDWVYSETEIPAKIMEAFKEKYPEATQEQWMIKEDRYKINFMANGAAHFTYFDRRGHWIKTFTKKDRQSVPDRITAFLDRHYQDYEVTKFYLKATPNGSGYTLALKRNGDYIWLEFDLDGLVIRNQA